MAAQDAGRRFYHHPLPNLLQARWWHRRDLPRGGVRLWPRVLLVSVRRAGLNCSLVARVGNIEGVDHATAPRPGAFLAIFYCVRRVVVVRHSRHGRCGRNLDLRARFRHGERGATLRPPPRGGGLHAVRAVRAAAAIEWAGGVVRRAGMCGSCVIAMERKLCACRCRCRGTFPEFPELPLICTCLCAQAAPWHRQRCSS